LPCRAAMVLPGNWRLTGQPHSFRCPCCEGQSRKNRLPKTKIRRIHCRYALSIRGLRNLSRTTPHARQGGLREGCRESERTDARRSATACLVTRATDTTPTTQFAQLPYASILTPKWQGYRLPDRARLRGKGVLRHLPRQRLSPTRRTGGPNCLMGTSVHAFPKDMVGSSRQGKSSASSVSSNTTAASASTARC
jgi:hypothetical protein